MIHPLQKTSPQQSKPWFPKICLKIIPKTKLGKLLKFYCFAAKVSIYRPKQKLQPQYMNSLTLAFLMNIFNQTSKIYRAF